MALPVERIVVDRNLGIDRANTLLPFTVLDKTEGIDLNQ